MGVTQGTDTVVVGAGGASLEDVVRVAQGARVELSPEAVERIEAGRAVVDRYVHGDRLIYGLNTLLGHGRNTRVPVEELEEYNLAMVDGHAGGLGEPLPDADVRAMTFVRIASAATGASGLHLDTVQLLAEMLNRGVIPVVPEEGSIGASDLMHMGAVAMVAIGRGEASLDGEVLAAAEALERVGLQPRRPLPKEGLALVSYNGASIGIGALVVAEAERVARLADRVAALSFEAYHGNPGVFRPEVALLKPIQGLAESATLVRDELAGSYLYDGEVSVQDPLSFRTVPQVHGGLREQVRSAREAVETELRSVDDNPLVLVETGELISAGNFHPVSLALAFDAMRIGLAHVGMISERRLMKLRWGKAAATAGAHPSQQTGQQQRPDPRSIAGRRRLSSYGAVVVLTKLKGLARPATLDVTALAQDVEDHATNAPVTVLQTREANHHLDTILCVEALSAAGLIEQSGGLRLGAGTQRTYGLIRETVAGIDPIASTAAVVEAVRGALAQS